MTFCRFALVSGSLALLAAQTPVPKPAAPKPAAPRPAVAKPAAAPKPAAGAKVSAPDSSSAPASSGSKMFPDIPATEVVLTVGEEKITAAQLAEILQALPAQYQTPQGRKQFIENYAKMKVLAQEGKRRGLDHEASYRAQVALNQDNLLAQATYNAIAQSTPVGPEQIEQYYNAHKNEFENARASHILIRFKGSPAPQRPGTKELTEEEALAKIQALRKEILAGGDFAAIAKRESDDGGSGAQGGDLGSFHRGQMVPAFEEAAFGLPIGQASEPVKTTYGYHIIKVVERSAKSMADAKDEIDKKMRPESAMKTVESLQKSANVVIDPRLTAEEKK